MSRVKKLGKWRWLRPVVLLLLGGSVCVGIANLSYQSPYVAPGIYPQPDTSFLGRRKQVRLLAERADVALIFIGGFGDVFTANFRCVYEGTPLLPCAGRQVRACYAWDGGEGSLLQHDTDLIQQDVQAFLRVNPGADLVFVGHSYGGSAIMDVVRSLAPGSYGKIAVATLDPVSCRARSMPRVRAQGVQYWVNSYCAPYRSAMDVAAKVGGPWRFCEEADANMCFSGKEQDSAGKRYRHSRPQSLFTDAPAGGGASAQELLFGACRKLGIGEQTTTQL